MILPDVNVLVHAFRSDSPDHRAARGWLDKLVNGSSRYAMAPLVLSGVVRIATHPRVFAEPSSLEESLAFCRQLFDQPHCVPVREGERHWEIFSRLCRDSDARGNLVPDAWLAALAIEAGCEWITLDRDFARFEGLKWSLPW